jgi:ketosteroid isomerase-like protein
MIAKRILSALGAALLLTGASALGALEPGESSRGTLESAVDPDLDALRASLRAAELAFADSLASRDLERFSSFLSDQAIFVSGGVLRGKPAILEGWSVFFGESAPSLVWEPEIVVIQPGGAMGLTRGPFTYRQTAPDGTVQSQSGVFTSIWQRQRDDGWKIVFDIGCPPCRESPEIAE